MRSKFCDECVSESTSVVKVNYLSLFLFFPHCSFTNVLVLIVLKFWYNSVEEMLIV